MTATDALRNEITTALAGVFERLIAHEIGAGAERDARGALYLRARAQGIGAIELGRLAGAVAETAVERAVAEHPDADPEALLKACGATEATVRVTERNERHRLRVERTAAAARRRP